jgi:hypothetical protein
MEQYKGLHFVKCLAYRKQPQLLLSLPNCSGSGQGLVAGSCEQVNKPLGYMKCGEFFGYLKTLLHAVISLLKVRLPYEKQITTTAS